MEIGIYKVDEGNIAVGTMATVVKGTHILTGERVAIKLLKMPNPKYEDRFIQEAKILKSINHENILRVYEISKTEDYLYYSMEFYEKVLTEFLDPLPFTSEKEVIKLNVSEKLKILHQISIALNVLHSEKIVHRDIAPNNILIRPSDLKVVLCDLGLSKIGDVELPESERGNPKLYGAPEQDYALGNSDFSSDIYSFGVLAYQFLSGALPKGQGLKDLSILNTEVPNEISKLINNCLDIEKGRRPSSVKLLEVFDKYLYRTSNSELLTDIENIPIPFQLHSFLGKGYLDNHPYEVDEVSFYLRHCSNSFSFNGIACKALEIPEFRRKLQRLNQVDFIIANPNNMELMNIVAKILNKNKDLVIDDINKSIEYLKQLSTENTNLRFYLSDDLPEWRVSIVDEFIGLLRNYKGNRYPFESPMLVVDSGPFLEGLIRYSKNKVADFIKA